MEGVKSGDMLMEDGRWTSAVEVIVKRGLLSDVTTTNVSADSNSFKRLI